MTQRNTQPGLAERVHAVIVLALILSIPVAAYYATEGFTSIAHPMLFAIVLPCVVIAGVAYAIREWGSGRRAELWDDYGRDESGA